MAGLVAVSLTWYLVSLSGVMAPGPIAAMAISEGARRGAWAGPLITLGHAVTELAMVVALAIGLRDLLQRPLVAGTIGLVGGVVLLWMGYGLARAAWRDQVSLRADDPPDGVARLGPVSAGVLLSVGNPYWLVWWATVGASYFILFGEFGLPGLIAFYVGHVTLDLAWNSLLAFVSASGRRAVPQPVYRGVLLVCGLFLIGMSVYFVRSGIGFLRG
jgi:threonine/homoserine/homoserine lactone efflux protein